MSPYVRLIPLGILLLLTFIAAIGLLGTKETSQSPMIGQRVTYFDLPAQRYSNTRFDPSHWQGKVAVINFFASWCEPCAIEHPALMKLAQTGKVDIFGIAWKDSEEAAAAWLSARGNPYKLVGIDQFGTSTVVFGMSGVPETFVLDQNGIVVFNYRSALTDEIVNEKILPLLETLRGQVAQ